MQPPSPEQQPSTSHLGRSHTRVSLPIACFLVLVIREICTILFSSRVSFPLDFPSLVFLELRNADTILSHGASAAQCSCFQWAGLPPYRVEERVPRLGSTKGSSMDQAQQLWMWWHSLLTAFAPVFIKPGWVRCAPWVTGMMLCWEEQTITQILMALGLELRWRVLEHFAEYGAWDRKAVERHTLPLIEQERPARWGRYRPVALDDTTLHRTSAKVWGTCTFHESSARSPNRAETVRAHNWVVMGDLVAGTPWMYLPHAARLYCRKNQLPAGENFQTKTTLNSFNVTGHHVIS